MNPVLQFQNINKSYGKRPVLNNISFTLEPGKITGLLGPNGCGKTTLLKLTAGLLQPNSGTILVDNLALGMQTKSLISYLPERTYLNDWMKIHQLLEFFSDFYTDFDKTRAMEMLSDLNINPNDKLKTLSKGTKEKVQLILVMSRRAKLYLLDEPIGGVDPAARDYILRTILTNYAEDSSILISTHLIQDVETMFTDVLFLSNGSMVIKGDVDDVREKHGKSIDLLFREVFKC